MLSQSLKEMGHDALCMGLSFSASFMRIGKRMLIFYQWPIFERVLFLVRPYHYEYILQSSEFLKALTCQALIFVLILLTLEP